jgi:hypothetical protein
MLTIKILFNVSLEKIWELQVLISNHKYKFKCKINTIMLANHDLFGSTSVVLTRI